MSTLLKRPLKISALVQEFSNAGFPISASWIRRQEDKGNLIVPKSPTNFKKTQGSRRIGAVRIFTENQIREIVKAFIPEGTRLPNGDIATGRGYYNYKEDNAAIPQRLAGEEA